MSEIDEPWIDEITEESLPNDDLRAVAFFCGLEMAINLLKNYPAGIINIPKMPFRKLRNVYILQNYDGTSLSLKKLAKATNLSQRHILRIVKKN